MRTSVKLKTTDPGSPHASLNFISKSSTMFSQWTLEKHLILLQLEGESSYFEICILFFFISPVVRRNLFFFSWSLTYWWECQGTGSLEDSLVVSYKTKCSLTSHAETAPWYLPQKLKKKKCISTWKSAYGCLEQLYS